MRIALWTIPVHSEVPVKDTRPFNNLLDRFFAKETKIFAKISILSFFDYIVTFLKWLFLGIVTGTACGLVGTVFSISISHAKNLRLNTPALIYALPAAGALLGFIYKKVYDGKDPGTNIILQSVRGSKSVPAVMSVTMYFATVITHIFGGSSGREGAALQVGGSIATMIAKLLRLRKEDHPLAIMCGMSGLFSAIFGTPIGAAIFAMEVVNVGSLKYAGIVGCVTSSIMASIIVRLFGIKGEFYFVTDVPVVSTINLLRVIILGIICAIAGIIICFSFHKGEHLAEKLIPNTVIRGFLGGAIILIMTLLVGSQDYNGAGDLVIEHAIMNGEAVWYAALLKLIFTTVTLAAGFKGGEIVPTYFIGATLGCVIGPLIGLPASFSAAACMIGTYCAVVNCPLASIVLSIEHFGADGLLYYAMVCAIGFMLSGNFSLYKEQRIEFSKLRHEVKM